MEASFIKFLQAVLPDVPVYSFVIPEDAPSPAFCIENAGYGISTHRYNNDNIVNRVIKLTVSSKNVSDIYNDKHLRDYIDTATNLGELKIIGMRINSFADDFIPELKIYERTYTITIRIKE